MFFPFKRIHHLIRYFFILGLLSFVGYIQQWKEELFLLILGPPIYLAAGLRKAAVSYLGDVSFTRTLHLYLFLLPVVLFYFGLLGFLLKQLWNERGFMRTFSLFALIVFLLYIHYTTWTNLLGYFNPL